MKIAEITNRLKSDEITVSKSIGSLIISTTKSLDQLVNEKISIYIERGNGNNVILCNKVNLKDFILSSTYGSEAVQSDGTMLTIALCEIALHGSILLAEKESIKIQLDDLIANQTYVLHAVEEPNYTNDIYFWEQKTVSSEDFNKKIDVHGFDLAVMTTHESVSDVSYQFENAQVVKYLPFELQTLSRDVDPVQYITVDGTIVQGVAGRLCLPLLHVNSIEINKSQGTIINFLVRTNKNVQ